jgi:hypothetical protein
MDLAREAGLVDGGLTRLGLMEELVERGLGRRLGVVTTTRAPTAGLRVFAGAVLGGGDGVAAAEEALVGEGDAEQDFA